MSTLIVYGDTSDAYMKSDHATDYPTARAGNSPSSFGSSPFAGQTFTGSLYRCWQLYLAWDTSALGDATAATCALSLWLELDQSTQDFVSRVRLHDWGTTVEAGDWIPGANFPGSYTLLAHIDSNGIGATGAYKNFIDDAFAANVNAAGFTRVVVTSDRFEAGTTPTGLEQMSWSDADTGGAGTTQDPMLTITYFPPPLPPRAVYDEFPKFLLRSN